MKLKLSIRNLLSLLSVVALMLIMSGCSTTVKENDLTELGLLGKVKSYRSFEFKAVDKFGNIEKGDRVKWSTSMHVIFNKEGYKEEENEYDHDGDLELKKLYKYDDNWNKSEMDYYNPDGSLLSKWIYKYDENHNMTEESSYKSDGRLDDKYSYKYDEKGNLIEIGRAHV